MNCCGRGYQIMGMSPDGFEVYLKAFRYGMPPHSDGAWALRGFS